MHGTGNSSTKTLKINCKCEPVSAKNIDVTDSPVQLTQSRKTYALKMSTA